MRDDSKRNGPDGTYQGHKNWTYWNVALYLSNDYATYRMMCTAVQDCSTRDDAAKRIMANLRNPEMPHKRPRTPDGARYSVTAIRAALVGWES